MSLKMLDGLLPELAAKARIHLAKCDNKGLKVAVTSGLRTWAEQMELYKTGRAMTDHGWVVTHPHDVVTLSLPDHSAHCRGAAYDLAPIVDERAAWERLDLFQAIADQAHGLCLMWGGTWPRIRDLPHYELPAWRELPIKES